MKETVYDHVAGNDFFSVTAAERWSIGIVTRLAEKYPEQVTIVHRNQDGSLLAHVPVAWMRIRPKKQVVMSEERREELRERLKNARAVRFGDTPEEEGEEEDDLALYADEDDEAGSVA